MKISKNQLYTQWSYWLWPVLMRVMRDQSPSFDYYFHLFSRLPSWPMWTWPSLLVIWLACTTLPAIQTWCWFRWDSGIVGWWARQGGNGGSAVRRMSTDRSFSRQGIWILGPWWGRQSRYRIVYLFRWLIVLFYAVGCISSRGLTGWLVFPILHSYLFLHSKNYVIAVRLPI